MAFKVLNPIVAGKYELKKNKILLSKHDFPNYRYCFLNSCDVEGIES